MAQRDYRKAAAVYREILREQTAEPDAPHAMLHLAVIKLVATGSLHDQAGAQNLLRRLVDRFPDSPERPTAEALLSLGNQADGLRRQLEELKRIDLGAGPSPTPH
jgi:TolA-binding protein